MAAHIMIEALRASFYIDATTCLIDACSPDDISNPQIAWEVRMFVEGFTDEDLFETIKQISVGYSEIAYDDGLKIRDVEKEDSDA